MNLLTRRRNVNTKARIIVGSATKRGYNYEQIAEICEVSVGSVKRWLSTGRADADKIKPLEDKIGNVYLPPESVADILVEIYKNKKKRFRLKRFQLKRIAGRTTLRGAFVDEVSQRLIERGYYMIEAIEKEDDFFVIIRVRQLLSHVKNYLNQKEINHYYTDLADVIDDYEEESVD